jgi:hypothetical protein
MNHVIIIVIDNCHHVHHCLHHVVHHCRHIHWRHCWEPCKHIVRCLPKPKCLTGF